MGLRICTSDRARNLPSIDLPVNSKDSRVFSRQYPKYEFSSSWDKSCYVSSLKNLVYRRRVFPNTAVGPRIDNRSVEHQGVKPMENLERLFTLAGCPTELNLNEIFELKIIMSELYRFGYLNDENYFRWQNENDETPIEVAIKAGNTAMVGVLLENGSNGMLEEALLFACEKGNEQVVNLSLSLKAHHNVDIYQQINCVLKCTELGNHRVLEMLHRAGFPLRSEGRSTMLNLPQTPEVPALWIHRTDGSLLHVAAGKGHHQIVDYLIEWDADIESVDSCGRKPVHLALQGGIHCLRRLLREGVDIEAVDNDGQTPLFLAASFGDFTALKTLVQHDAELDTYNDEGFSALLAAASANHDKIVKYLLDEGVVFAGMFTSIINFDRNPFNLSMSSLAQKRRLTGMEKEVDWAILKQLEEGGNVLPVTRLKLHIGVNPEVIFAEALKRGWKHVINLLDKLYCLENTVFLALTRSSLMSCADLIMSYAFPSRNNFTYM